MPAPILLTSFAPWQAHQRSNAADDLILRLMQRRGLPSNVVVLRHLPVHWQLAPCQVIAKAIAIRAAAIVCCGMAERRSLLTVEQCARLGRQTRATTLDLQQLIAGTRCTDISQYAGRYVCNHLYYQILRFDQECSPWPMPGLFIHVPVLQPSTEPWLAEDLQLILKKLQVLATTKTLASAA